jgi:ADP-ribosylglycohydrolase
LEICRSQTGWFDMLGAIIGDIVGSVYEWHSIKTKDFPLFRDDCFFTDDTVMTVAVAEAMQNGGNPDDFIDAMKKWGRLYPDAGYGGQFRIWLFSDSREPYNSWGNGSAMRVSPVPFIFTKDKLSGGIIEVTALDINLSAYAGFSAEVTHNHPEGIKGARAVADCIMWMLFGRKVYRDVEKQKSRLRGFIEERYGYDLSRTLTEIRPTYRFDVSCQGTVPQAITAFIESTDFEDAIRNAISLGGDSDTLAAITGGIAEAAYGIPDWIAERAMGFLDKRLRSAVKSSGLYS